jgi:hypothetical protein
VGLFLLLLPFNLIGALMAYLISYDELQRHSDRATARHEAARRGAVTFAFLLALSFTVLLVVGLIRV